MITHVMAHGRVEDFDFGLEIVLDGLERTLVRG